MSSDKPEHDFRWQPAYTTKHAWSYAVCIDAEFSGPDPTSHDLMALAAVPFAYTQPFQWTWPVATDGGWFYSALAPRDAAGWTYDDDTRAFWGREHQALLVKRFEQEAGERVPQLIAFCSWLCAWADWVLAEHGVPHIIIVAKPNQKDMAWLVGYLAHEAATGSFGDALSVVRRAIVLLSSHKCICLQTMEYTAQQATHHTRADMTRYKLHQRSQVMARLNMPPDIARAGVHHPLADCVYQVADFYTLQVVCAMSQHGH